MTPRLLPIVSGTLISVCVAAAVSANTLVMPRLHVSEGLAATKPFAAVTHHVRNGKTVATCPGPSSIGPNSFVGVTTGSNIAGGQVTQNPNVVTQYSGVVAGCGNFAGSSFTGILAGTDNTVGTGEFYDVDTAYSVIGGGTNNSIASADNAAILSGSGNTVQGDNTGLTAGASAIVAGGNNLVSASGSLIGGGGSNSILSVLPYRYYSSSAFIGAGDGNSIIGSDNAIVGGTSNSVGSVPGNIWETNSSIGGGSQNSLIASYSNIGGGSENFVTGQYSAEGGGQQNQISGEYGTIAGGHNGVASGLTSTVGGGYANIASGQNATIPGGASNTASGRNSFAAGGGSRAANDGTFVWSDYSQGAKTLSSSASNQFLARASGGFRLYSAANLSTGVSLAPGSGSWSSVSDRAAKTAIRNIDDASILAKVAALPVSEWSYIAQGISVRHLGPMAQDFRAAFGLGEDDRRITTIDEEGVALAAIKALQVEVAQKTRKVDDLSEKYARLERRLNALEAGSPTTKRAGR